MQEIYEILEYLGSASEVFLFVFLCSLMFVRYDPIFTVLFDFALIKVVVMIFTNLIDYLEYWDLTLISFFQNSYTILYFLIATKIYKTLLINQNVVRFGTILFVAALSINSLLFDFRFVFFNYTVSVLNLILTSYGIIYITTNQISIVSGETNKYFWVNIALLSYNLCLFSAMFFDHLIISNSSKFIGELLWMVVLISSIILNILLSIFIFEMKSVREVEINKK
jgi:hypothetical protein